MPGFPNKIIINSWRTQGANSLIRCDYDSLAYLGDELQEMDKSGKLSLKDTVDLRDRLKDSCDKHAKAEMEHHQELEAIIEETRLRIDKALGL